MATTKRRRSDLEILWGQATSPPPLVPLFGVRTFGADTPCDAIHPGGPIPSGSRCVCMVCSRSGVDHFPSVQHHTKAGNGQIREGWETVASQPTKYEPLAKATTTGKRLRGGTGN